MKIVYLNPVGVLGGGERNLLDIMACVQARPEFELHLVCGSDGPLCMAARDLGIAVTVVPMPDRLAQLGDSDLTQRTRLGRVSRSTVRLMRTALCAASYARTLGQVIQRLAPDLVHSNGIKCHLLTRLAVPRSIPVIWQVQDYLGSRPLVPHLLRRATSSASRVIAISQSVADDVHRTLPDTRVELIYSAIDTDAFCPGAGESAWLDDLAGLSHAKGDVVRIGLVATYARWKGHDVFLKAAARLVAQRKQLRIRFYIVGGPIYATGGSQFSESELRNMTKQLGIADCVAFVPFQERIVDVYRSLDIVVHASTQPEPFGRTIVEAMSCGRAVVVAARGGAAELVSHEETALAIEPGDATLLSAALERLIYEPDLNHHLAGNARTAACQRFSRPRLGREIFETYSTLLASHMQ